MDDEDMAAVYQLLYKKFKVQSSRKILKQPAILMASTGARPDNLLIFSSCFAWS
jgi:hypothetical protein